MMFKRIIFYNHKFFKKIIFPLKKKRMQQRLVFLTLLIINKYINIPLYLFIFFANNDYGNYSQNKIKKKTTITLTKNENNKYRKKSYYFQLYNKQKYIIIIFFYMIHINSNIENKGK